MMNRHSPSIKTIYCALALFFVAPSHIGASEKISAKTKLIALGAVTTSGVLTYLWQQSPTRSFSERFITLEMQRNEEGMKKLFAQYSTQELEQAEIQTRATYSTVEGTPLLLWMFSRLRNPLDGSLEFHQNMFAHLLHTRKCDVNTPFIGQYNTNIHHGPNTVIRPTLLHLACLHGNHDESDPTALLQPLLDARANVNALSSGGLHSPLHLCCAKNLFYYARWLIEHGATITKHGLGLPPLEIALRDYRRYENGLTSLLLIAGAREIPKHYYDPKIISLSCHFQNLFHAPYHKLVHIVEFQNDPANRTQTCGPKWNTLSTQEYAEIMQRRLANLTDPEEQLECAARLRYLEDPVASSWREFQHTAPWVQTLDENLPTVITDIVLEYAAPNLGPIMERKEPIKYDTEGNPA